MGLNLNILQLFSEYTKIAYLDDIANLEILPYGLHISEVMSFTKSIKDIDA